MKIDYVAVTGKNWWQVALVVGVAMGAFVSMKFSGAERRPILPIWRRALGSPSPAKRYAVTVAVAAVFAGGITTAMLLLRRI